MLPYQNTCYGLENVAQNKFVVTITKIEKIDAGLNLFFGFLYGTVKSKSEC